MATIDVVTVGMPGPPGPQGPPGADGGGGGGDGTLYLQWEINQEDFLSLRNKSYISPIAGTIEQIKFVVSLQNGNNDPTRVFIFEGLVLDEEVGIDGFNTGDVITRNTNAAVVAGEVLMIRQDFDGADPLQGIYTGYFKITPGSES